MANLNDVDDLRVQALWRAGEPQDSTSDFWAQSLIYLNKVQQILLLGGGAAVGRDLATSAGIYNMTVAIPLTDWWWARETGVLTTTAAIESGTVTATRDSATLTFSASITPDVQGWRISINNQETVPLISVHGGATATATMDAVWPQATETTSTYLMWQEDHTLATDFLRWAGAPELHSDFAPPLPVTNKEQLHTEVPLSSRPQGAPQAAAMTRGQTIIFDRADADRRYRFEYEYIKMPSDLAAGNTPLLPAHHRQVLSTGAAMLMLFDKGDSRAENCASEFRELVMRMAQEHRKALGSGSNTFMQHRVRQPGRRRVRGSQTFGEQYLV